MKDFIKSKYFEFVESIKNINDCTKLIKDTESVLLNLESNVQVQYIYLYHSNQDFLVEFSQNYINNMKKKEDLQNIKEEREKLKYANIFFAYLNKANLALNEQQFESTIQLIKTAEDKFLKFFPLNSVVTKRGNSLIQRLRSKITTIVINILIRIYKL